MLVLSRKVGEGIVIDGGIVVRVTEIHGNRVRLGIDAPVSTRVDREEVRERVAAAGFQPVSQSSLFADTPSPIARRRRHGAGAV